MAKPPAPENLLSVLRPSLWRALFATARSLKLKADQRCSPRVIRARLLSGSSKVC